jgi:hypothetical protein
MRRILIEHLPPAEVYMEDIEEICSYIEQLTNEMMLSNDIIFRIDDIELDNYEELYMFHKRFVTNLEMCSNNTGLNIYFHPNDISVYSIFDDPEHHAIFTKIINLVQKRKNFLIGLVTGYNGILFYGILFSIFCIMFLITLYRQIVFTNVALMLFIIVLGVYAFILRRNMFSRIHLEDRDDISYIIHNKDTIIAVILFLLSIIIGHIWK